MKRNDAEPVQHWFWYMREKKGVMVKWVYDLWSCGSASQCRSGKARARCQRKDKVTTRK
jgi:hypothetical protein